MAFELNIFHPSKRVPWGGASANADLVLVGTDWSAAAFSMSFAATQGGTAIADIQLANAAAGSQGISASYDASYVHPETGAVVGATTIRPQIDEASLEALVWGSDPTANLVLHYDLLVTPVGGVQQVFCYGTFTIQPGIGD
ncbi:MULTISPECIES: hypothetical protein [unclassified Novosphingobium]|uniref:hypothetical protein n=1 Tax=unclassified Novosphingobium TaxID=2644732 RepID=UPI000D2FF2A5|nr:MULTISPECIES: hypothetical protein [unclassified Novosphingobium]PTR08671.1 hypothetical protein C8K11_111117 [Novosphingobium sp. GV055]PUB01394.1 hypothetical protein C8K12_111117 [Novosphingobium sp. GV061]PUB16968.1 hypothetical protein C8K14_111117 [Novosphingobium sp. GV079]PUB39991.1 hypothetical protein C8K10_111117 [Novosphingobium sp. GV027]